MSIAGCGVEMLLIRLHSPSSGHSLQTSFVLAIVLHRRDGDEGCLSCSLNTSALVFYERPESCALKLHFVHYLKFVLIASLQNTESLEASKAWYYYNLDIPDGFRDNPT